MIALNTYPFTVCYKGIIGQGHWVVWNALTDSVIGYYKDVEEAHQVCRWAKNKTLNRGARP